jgi:hypothetical protein
MKYHKKLRDYDLPHLGALCERNRVSRGISASLMQERCGVKNVSTITRNFEEFGDLGRKPFREYVQTLQLPGLAKPRNFDYKPLKQEQAEMLMALYDHSRDVDKRQCELGRISFDAIKPEYRGKELDELVNELANEERPAFIMDDLWFIHALNGAVLELFGETPDSESLNAWEAWHVMAAKFHSESRVRKTHTNPDEYFPPTVEYFFQAPNTYRYLFTLQMRTLLLRLLDLSEQHHTGFKEMWYDATCFNIRYELRALTRHLWYQGEEIKTEAGPRLSQEVEITPGNPVRYTLAVWNPVGKAAKEAFAHIHNLSGSQELVYAADKDSSHNFHVNDWLGVKEELEKWECF